jgi:hypothetical protein
MNDKFIFPDQAPAMSDYVPHRIRDFEPLLFLFEQAAREHARRTARVATKTPPRTPRRSRGRTLRPGAATPLWNELVKTVHLNLRRRGAKVNLARYLGIHRQRLHVLIVSRQACPDAERTLMLLVWLLALRGKPV